MSPTRLLGLERAAAYFDRVNESASARLTWQGLLLLVASVLTLLLIDRTFAYSFEADSESTITFVQAFSGVFSTGRLPAPEAYPPYFDGQYIIYTVVALCLKTLVRIGLISTAVLPPGQSVAICAIRCTNAASRVVATMFVFSTANLLSRSNLLAFACGLLFLLSPQILEIDLSRIDHVVAVLLAALIYLCVRLLERGPTRGTFALIGIVAGALATTKITSVVFTIVPAIALVFSWRTLTVRRIGVLVMTFVATAVLLSFRYVAFEWLHPGLFYSSTVAKFNAVKAWYTVLSVTPYFFYSYQELLPYGLSFVVVSWGSVAVVLSRGRSAPTSALLVAVTLLIFSLLGVPSMKYARGGYHLVLLHILAIAAAVPVAQRLLGVHHSAARRWIALLAAALLVPAGATVVASYSATWREARNLQVSIAATRLIPREWFRAHIPPGSRIVRIISSDWTTPPMQDLGYSFSYGFLTFPYLDKDKMSQYLPPPSDQIADTTDAILLSDLHKTILMSHVRTLGLNAVAEEWERFFASLKTRYPHVMFEAASPNYGVRSIEVYVVSQPLAAELLRQGLLVAPLTAR